MTMNAFTRAGGTIAARAPPRVTRAEVVVRGDRIVDVVKSGGETPRDAIRIDASGCVITPAFVVGHTHLYSALACGMPPPARSPENFRQILEEVWWRLDKALT